ETDDTSGVVPGGRNGRHPGQLLALEQLEARSTARRDPGDHLGETDLVEGPHRVGAADDGERVLICGDSPGDGLRPFCEVRPLEDAHGAVPEDRPRPFDALDEPRARLGPDVEPEPAVRDLVDGAEP